MQLDLDRTIVALSSGLAPARRAIVRMSGGQTRELLSQLVRPSSPQTLHDLLGATQACSVAGAVDIGWSGRCLPARIYYWPDSRSYTGEPSAELHLLSSLPIVEALIERLLSLGAAPAERGEFTLRSFLAGKIDLTQAEAVLGVIEADTPAQLTQALSQLGGNLSHPIRRLRDELLELVAHLEAGLDFVEEDIEFITAEQLSGKLQSIADRLGDITAQLSSRGSRTRRARVVLVGLPNAGKSSLFNALLGRERAIVSEQAGTTRDAVADLAALGDLQIELIDTAGIEELGHDSPRGLAQAMLHDRLKQSDMAVLCIDSSQATAPEWLSQQRTRLEAVVPVVVVIGTKADLVPVATSTTCQLFVSVHDTASVERLREHLTDVLSTRVRELHSDAMHEAAVRCHGAIEVAQATILRAIEIVNCSGGEELVAAELRGALDDLSAVIGEVHTEDILGQIFSRFCIGK